MIRSSNTCIGNNKEENQEEGRGKKNKEYKITL